VTSPKELRARADVILELHEDDRLDAALEACDDLVRLARDADPTDPVVRESLFSAWFERGLLLSELGDLRTAAEAYGEAAATPADLDDPDQRHEVAMALLNRAICLDASAEGEGQGELALATYDQLIERFGDADDPVTRDQVIRGRVNRAAALLAADRPEQALAGADALIGELDALDVLEAEQLAMAVRLRAAALRALDRVDDAEASLTDVERCTDEDPAVRSQIAAAHRERAELLAELGRVEEAVDLLGATVGRFRGDPDPVVGEVLADLIEVEERLLGAGGDRGSA
jgi:tetratricopeptide (TPR) repeat protein